MTVVLLLVTASVPAQSEGAVPPADVTVEACAERTAHPPIRIMQEEGPLGFVISDPVTGETRYRPGSGVAAGDGSPGNPFVIAGWCIVGPSTYLRTPPLVLIEGTDAHVVVEDNVVIGSGEHGAGVLLFKAENVHVRENRIVHVGFGVMVGDFHEAAPNNRVSGNTISSFSSGVALWDGPGAVVEDNVIDTNGGNGVLGSSASDGILVRNNTVYHDSVLDPDGTGIYLLGVAEVHGNSITSNRLGLLLSSASVASNNTITENDVGVLPAGSLLENNTITRNGVGVRVEAPQSNPTFRYNNIHGNVEGVGLDVVGEGATVDARWNWWGCPDGPKDSACDDVTGDAVFDPWLTQRNPDAGT